MDADAARVGQKPKPEAYYFPRQLNNYGGDFPYTFFGLFPGTTHDDIVNCLRNWDRGDNGITALSQAYVLRPGTGWDVPAGILHAPGSLCTYEPQFASDVFAMFQSLVADVPIGWDLLGKKQYSELEQALADEYGQGGCLEWYPASRTAILRAPDGDVAPTGGATGSGGGEGGGFEPCPETGPCKVLPLGDSITVGLGFDGGYRVELFRLALENGHEITFLGSQQPNGPQMVAGTPFPRQHEGISGQTITQIADRIPQPGLNEMPHIILLHAGTNDMVQGAAGATDRLASLIDLLIEEAPDALIVVSNIIPLPFAADADLTMRVLYREAREHSWSMLQVPYVLATGASWRGDVRRVDLEVRFADRRNFSDLSLAVGQSPTWQPLDVERDGDIIPIEVKSADTTRAKSLATYISLHKPAYAVKLSTKNFGFEDGKKTAPLYAAFCL